MNKAILFLLLLNSCLAFSQKKEQPSLENFQKKYRYVKSKDYKGPEGSYSSPANMEVPEEDYPQSNSSSKSNGGKIEYSPEEIERIRRENAQRQQGGSGSGYPGSGGSGSGGGNGKGNGGNQPRDPKMGQPKPIEFDPPDIDVPDIDVPDISPPSISAAFWKVFLIVLAAIVLLILIYYLVKNYKPQNRKIATQSTFDNWNPEVISKTELELRLEKAMAENDFRECVRIYFTFILKEMIRLRFINWKKELTNFDYLLQASSKPNFAYFEQTVRIYDLVWYGDYDISFNDYKNLEKHLENHYKLLNASNA